MAVNTSRLRGADIAAALAAAQDADMDWPYIDNEHGDIIDGRLRIVCDWLASNYVILSEHDDNGVETFYEHRCPRMREHLNASWQPGGRDPLPTPCPECSAVRVTQERVPYTDEIRKGHL